MTDCPSSADDSQVPESPAFSDDLTTPDAALVDGMTMPSDAGKAAERVTVSDDVLMPQGLAEPPCTAEALGVNEIESSDVDPTDGMTVPDGASEDGPSTSDAVALAGEPSTSEAAPSASESHGLPFCWWHYAIKAAAVVALLFLFSRVAAWAPGWCVAVVWAVCSVLLAAGITYHAVVKKTINQAALHAGGMLGRINGGRTFRLIAAFIVSAVGVAGLLVASVGWDAWQWGLAVAAVPLFLLVHMLVDKVVGKEAALLFRASLDVRASACITGGLLFVASFALFAVQPTPEVTSATEAFLSAENPFASSPSTIMSEAGLAVSYADALSTYGLSRLGELNAFGRYCAQGLLLLSSLFGLAGLLGTCALDSRELKRVFLPLEKIGAEQETTARASRGAGAPRSVLLKAPVVAAIAAPLILVGAFVASDSALAQMKAADELTPAENLVREAFGTTAYVLDSKYYDQQQVQTLMEETAVKTAALSENARNDLIPLVNAVFDARVANVDSYLDWYYSLGADYERLGNLITGTIESFVADQLTESLEAGVDDSEFVSTLQSYVDQAAAINAGYEEGLANSELIGIPEWLLTSTEAITADFLSGPIEPTQRLLDAGERFGISATVGGVGGVAAGVATSKAVGGAAEKAATSAGEKAATSAASSAGEKAAAGAAGDAAEKAAGKQAAKAAEKAVTKNIGSKIVEKAAGKAFFKAIVSRIGSMIGSRGVGAAVGGAAGTLVGPGVGTAVGIAAGAAIGVGVDYGLLMLDEAQNRESYKAEIIEAIEEERADLLAQIE